MPSSIGHIKAGKLRALAVTTATRSEVLPDLPTLGDFVPGYEASTWFGIVAPTNTPAEIIEKLNNAINAGLADPKITARLAEMGGILLAGSPSDFGKLIAEETEKWGKVDRSSASIEARMRQPSQMFRNFRSANSGTRQYPDDFRNQISASLSQSRPCIPAAVPLQRIVTPASRSTTAHL